MTSKTLTPDQLKELAPCERFFDQVLAIRQCSYPGRQNIDTMLRVWKEHTGKERIMQRGCSECLLNLVKDMAQLYRAAKEAQAEASQAPAPALSEPKTTKKTTPKKTAKK